MANTEENTLAIGDMDSNGYIVFEEKEISNDDWEWIGDTEDRLILTNVEMRLLIKIMERGATRKQAEKTLLDLRAKAVNQKDALNSLVKKEDKE